jgi:hypothetical protein
MAELPKVGLGGREQNERRLVERLLRHWTAVALGKRFPRPDEIDPWIADDRANCLLIAVEAPMELSHFVAVGENLAVALGAKDTVAGLLLSHLPRVVAGRRCLIIEGGATHRGTPVLFRGALLPLSEDGLTIDHVLGATNYRVVVGQLTRQPVRLRWA